MNTTTKFWCGLISEDIDCSDVLTVPAADAGDPITITTSRDVDAKPSVDYG